MSPRIPLLILVVAASLHAPGAGAVEERSFDFHIPRQAAEPALQSLAHQTDTEVIFSPEQLAGVWTQSLIGQFTLSAAVSQLLTGTELKFTISEKGTIIVTRDDTSDITDQK